jgi:hypothetical protein
MTAFRLLIAIEHALPNWPLVDFRKEVVATYFISVYIEFLKSKY